MIYKCYYLFHFGTELVYDILNNTITENILFFILFKKLKIKDFMFSKKALSRKFDAENYIFFLEVGEGEI